MYLHDAIVTVLKSKPSQTATIQEIADEINKLQLYKRKDKEPLPSYQVMMRTKLANKKYFHLFEWMSPDKVKLKK